MQESSSQNRPFGVTLLGRLLMISSLVHIQALLFSQDWYKDLLYGYMPVWMANLRYGFSWFQRFLGITAALGILRGKNWGRLLAIGIGCFTIATLYWKHPYKAFERHTEYLDQIVLMFKPLLREIGLSFKKLTLSSLIVHYILDIIFNASMIIYLTRPKIKEYFQKKS